MNRCTCPEEVLGWADDTLTGTTVYGERTGDDLSCPEHHTEGEGAS